jgi:ABC-2 type transport system permease protein
MTRLPIRRERRRRSAGSRRTASVGAVGPFVWQGSHRRGERRRLLDLVLHQARYDVLTLIRNRRARVFTLVMPVVLLVVFAAIWGDQMVGSGVSEATLASYYVPGLTGLAIITACFAGIAMAVAGQREAGILKRRRSTPVPASVLILARSLSTVSVAVVMTVLLAAIGRIGYGVTISASAVPGLLLTAIVGAIAFCCLGYALSTVLTTPDTSAPIVNLALLPLFLISGVYYPNVAFPGWLQDLARAFPVQPLTHGLHQAFAPGASGIGVSVTDLGVLAAWGLIGLAIAVRRFSWLPKAAVA